MTIKEFAGIKKCDIDAKTGERLTHQEMYRRIINKLGYSDVKKCIPFTLSEIEDMYERDEYMNFKMSKWDAASGVACGSRGASVVYTPLVFVYKNNGITSFSQSEGVCILKECAIMWLEEESKKDVSA